MDKPPAIPEDPAEFFECFLPAQFARDRRRYGREDSAGWAMFEVIGVGAWGIRLARGQLAVTRGKPDGTLLQIGVSHDDFRALFVERTQREVDETGDVSDDSRDVFKPLFADRQTVDALASAAATLAVHVHHAGATRRLFITPGPCERTAPRATITLQLGDFLALLSGRRGFARLLLLGHLKIRGDVLYARRLSVLLT